MPMGYPAPYHPMMTTVSFLAWLSPAPSRPLAPRRTLQARRRFGGARCQSCGSRRPSRLALPSGLPCPSPPPSLPSAEASATGPRPSSHLCGRCWTRPRSSRPSTRSRRPPSAPPAPPPPPWRPSTRSNSAPHASPRRRCGRATPASTPCPTPPTPAARRAAGRTKPTPSCPGRCRPLVSIRVADAPERCRAPPTQQPGDVHHEPRAIVAVSPAACVLRGFFLPPALLPRHVPLPPLTIETYITTREWPLSPIDRRTDRSFALSITASCSASP